MPSTSDERAARWPGMDTQATEYLEGRGYILSRDGKWEWSMPEDATAPSARDVDAVLYLIEEWDFGGLRNSPSVEFTEYDFESAYRAEPDVEGALEIIRRYGGIDGGHHKAWVIDQVARKLLHDDYPAFVADAKSGPDGPETYNWDEGTAP